MDYLPFEILNCMKYSKNNNNEEMKKYLQSDKIDMFAIGILIYKLLFYLLNPFVTNKSTRTDNILNSFNKNTFDILEIKLGKRKKN